MWHCFETPCGIAKEPLFPRCCPQALRLVFQHHVCLKLLCLGCSVQMLLHAVKSAGSEIC